MDEADSTSCYSGYNPLDIHQEGEGLLGAHFNTEREEEEQKKIIEAKKQKGGLSVSEEFILFFDDEGEDVEPEVPPPAPVPVDLTPYLPTQNDSNDPSYTRLVLPYTAVCRQRLHKAQLKMKQQFIKEIKQHETFQSKALDGVRIHREFCRSIIKSPKAEEIIKLTKQQQEKLGLIMGREY